jgi:hypothetical protein
LHGGAVVRSVLQVYPKHIAFWGDHLARFGLHIARKQTQQGGFSCAFITANPAHARGPTEG